MIVTVHTRGFVTDEFKIKNIGDLIHILKVRGLREFQGLNQIEKDIVLKISEEMFIKIKCSSFSEAMMSYQLLRSAFQLAS